MSEYGLIGQNKDLLYLEYGAGRAGLSSFVANKLIAI